MANDDNPQPVKNDPVGQQLKRAREKASLTVSDVADAQHLRPVVIQAIEEGDYSRIDSELFLKGYVRAYAMQVGLDADAVINDLDHELEPLRKQREQEREENPLVDIERRRHRKRRMAKLLLLLVVAALAGYLAFTFMLPMDSTKEDVTVMPESAQPQDGEEIGDSVSQQGSEEPMENGPDTNGLALEIGEEPGVTRENPLEVPDSGVQLEPEVTSAEEGDPVVDVPPVLEEPAPVVEDPREPVAITAQGSLLITFTDDCWVQVSDASGTRLVNSLQRNGDQVEVSGQLPLKVVIGAVDAVGSIRFQGESVDMGDYPVVNNRSEFTLTI
ncbi:helix-turn-helix domain-containing protein [Marinobacter salinus]|uniref:Helix-turn-helix domain-containing protein n=1 Tax=Marinobacter salinus TaxID=1874317 RepID=A0A1D9GK74_9GAMM|nr:RodZ domain-containing protein [Marinobacter salinus]AOY87914.1 helix-turn-helix domain-containing protein [Marinobacter salinus]